jgi:hypothetical protein
MLRKAFLLSLILILSAGSVSAVDEENLKTGLTFHEGPSDKSPGGIEPFEQEIFAADKAWKKANYPIANYNEDVGADAWGYACLGGGSDGNLAGDDECLVDEWRDAVTSGSPSSITATVTVCGRELGLGGTLYVPGISDAWGDSSVFSDVSTTDQSNTIVWERGGDDIPQDIPCPTGHHRATFSEYVNGGLEGRVQVGELSVSPMGSQNMHKGRNIYVRMGVDQPGNQKSWDYKLYNFGLSSGTWNNYRNGENPDDGQIAITAVNPHSQDLFGDKEYDQYCIYDVSEGILETNSNLDSIITGQDSCSKEDKNDPINADRVKNLDFGTDIAVDLTDPEDGAGGFGSCIGQSCNIDKYWTLSWWTAIHDYGEYAPVGELARGEETGTSSDKWFICRRGMNFYNITIDGQKHMCTVPDGQQGGTWMEILDCQPGFSFEYRREAGWDCYAKPEVVMNVNFFRIHNVRDAGSGYEAGIMIEDSELQKFDQVFGMPVTKITAECWIGEPDQEPAPASPKALMETDPRSSYSPPSYEDEVWMLEDMETTSGVNETSYTCIYSIINDEGSEKVYEGSNDPPFKTSTSTKTIDVSDLPYSFTWDDGFIFDYPYPSGTLPSGDTFNEDPTSYHAFPYY